MKAEVGEAKLPALPEGWQKEAIEMVVAFFEEMNLPQSIRILEVESGHTSGKELASELQFVRGLILDGLFEDVLTFLRPLQMKLQEGAKRVLYEVQLQQFLELLEAHSGQDKEKVDILVMELKNLEALCSPEAFHQLCFCLTLPSVQDHPNFKCWTIHGGRRLCNEVVQSALEPLYPPSSSAPLPHTHNTQREPSRCTLQSVLRKAMAYDLMGSQPDLAGPTPGKPNWTHKPETPTEDIKIRAQIRPHTAEEHVGREKDKAASAMKYRRTSADDLRGLHSACQLADSEARDIGQPPYNNGQVSRHHGPAASVATSASSQSSQDNYSTMRQQGVPPADEGLPPLTEVASNLDTPVLEAADSPFQDVAKAVAPAHFANNRPSLLRVPPPLTIRARSSDSKTPRFDARRQEPIHLSRPPTNATSPTNGVAPPHRTRGTSPIERAMSLDPTPGAKSAAPPPPLERSQSEPSPFQNPTLAPVKLSPTSSNTPQSRPMGPITREFRRGYCMDIMPPPPKEDIAADALQQSSFGSLLLGRTQRERREERSEGLSSSERKEAGDLSAPISRRGSLNSDTEGEASTSGATSSRRASLNADAESAPAVPSSRRGVRADNVNVDREGAAQQRGAHHRRMRATVAEDSQGSAGNPEAEMPGTPGSLRAPPGRRARYVNVDAESASAAGHRPGVVADVAAQPILKAPPGRRARLNVEVESAAAAPAQPPAFNLEGESKPLRLPPGRPAHLKVEVEGMQNPPVGRRQNLEGLEGTNSVALPGGRAHHANVEAEVSYPGAPPGRPPNFTNADVDPNGGWEFAGVGGRNSLGDGENDTSSGHNARPDAAPRNTKLERIEAKRQKRVGLIYGMMEPYAGFTSTMVIKDIQPLRGLAWDRTANASFLAIGSNSRALRVFNVKGVVGMHDGGGSPPQQSECHMLGEKHDWHLGSIYAVDWNSRGALIATGSNDHTVKVARAVRENPSSLHLDCGTSDTPYVEGGTILEGHDGTVRDIAFSPVHENQLLSGGAGDFDIRVWDVSTELCTSRLQGHTGTVFALRLCKDGRTAISGGGDNIVRVWDLRTSLCTHSLPPHNSQISSLAVQDTAQWVVAGHEDGACRVLDLRSLTELRRLSHHTADCRSVDISPGGRWLLTGGFDHAVSIIDIQYGWRLAGLWRLHPDKVITTRWHPNGLAFATASADRTVCVWSPTNSQILSRKIRDHL